MLQLQSYNSKHSSLKTKTKRCGVVQVEACKITGPNHGREFAKRVTDTRILSLIAMCEVC